MKSYFVYILASRYRGATYIGVTSDLDKRIAQHKSKSLQGYTSRWGIQTLVHVERFQCVNEAISREKALKKWRREWKWNLIETSNPEWKDISNL